MRESIGSTFTLNIIILFIVIVFGILAATLSYYKAYKVNNRILDAIEQYEGYNEPAKDEISRILQSLGYPANSTNAKCEPKRDGAKLAALSDGTPGQLYCVYYYEDDRGKQELKNKETNKNKEPIYYNYSVVTYIYIQLPIVGAFKVPVYTKGERTYNFSCQKCTADGKCTFEPRKNCKGAGDR